MQITWDLHSIAASRLGSPRVTIRELRGDFSGLGIKPATPQSIKRQLLRMFDDAGLNRVLSQLKWALERKRNPDPILLTLTDDVQKHFVEQETVVCQSASGEFYLRSYWQNKTSQRQAEDRVKFLEEVIHSIPSWIFVKNEQHDYEMVNEAFASLHGVDPKSCIGKNAIDLGVPSEIAKGDVEKGIRGFWADDIEVFQSGEKRVILGEPIVVDGEERILQTQKTPIVDPQTGKQLLVGFCHDITYLKQIENQIGIELRHNKTLNEINRILRSEDRLQPACELICEVLTRVIGCAKVQVVLDGFAETAPASAQSTSHRQAVKFDGESIGYVQLHWETGESPDEHDQSLLSAICEKLASACHRQALVDQVNFQANHDSLTKLPNRFQLIAKLDELITESQQNKKICAVVMMDLDGFKTVNDTLGHQVGDQLLLAVSQRFQAQAQPNEFLARLGGDEFALLFSGLPNEQEGIERAETYLESLEQSFCLHGRELFVGASLGISFYPIDSCDASSMLRHADSAMYLAKSEGRNRCQVFTAEIAEQTRNRVAIENDLRKAILSGDELFLEYQPQLDLATHEVAGVEALVRWQHPQRGRLEPSQFIQIAEESGLIIDLGQWIMNKACHTVARWNQQLDQEITLSVNVTPLELEQRGMLNQIVSCLKDSGLKPHCLNLELTETFVMKRFEEVSDKLTKLKEFGIKISIDDFGTGHSCMSYLHRLPIDCLKIDRSFVQLLDFDSDLGPDRERRLAITQTIIALAKSMGLQTVAEGIETEYQHEHVSNLCSDIGQGFLFSRALGPEQALTFIRNQSVDG